MPFFLFCCISLLPFVTFAAYTPIFPTGEAAGQTWKYTTTAPAATWYQPSFSDAAWSSGLSAFGTAGTPGAVIRTTWNTPDIWLRKTAAIGALDSTLGEIVLRIIYDEDPTVYINGVLAWSISGAQYTASYLMPAISTAARNAIVANGNNVIAVHARQTVGGQAIDCGLGYMPNDTLTRARMLAPYLRQLRQIVFTKHLDIGGTHYAYTEALSDAEAERNFIPGAALCRMTIDTVTYAVTIDTLLATSTGIIRDPDVSFDGRRILFSWKKSDRGDDFHLYEMNAATKSIRQLTFGLGYADYEGCYLPSGNIIFSSTRCIQIVDCWWTEVSNLFICDSIGRYIRRLGFDQVHTNFPTITPDGTILYTRWEYNDRGQIFPQPLFEMYPDGTRQTAFYGNNSFFPTSILHARAIPGGGGKVVCIFSGHHNLQKGKLGIIDPSMGREENTGATLIAPVRQTSADHIDSYGQDGDQWQYPYPLDANNYLVTFRPSGAVWFGIYIMNSAGQFCLLATDPNISCSQPVPLAPRQAPSLPASFVDYRRKTGVYTMENIYYGPGLTGIPAGTIRKLRVVGLLYRASGIASNGSSGPAGSALVSTPVGVDNTSWDPKVILGEADVYGDGSASFEVPARTPLYFQAIDSLGRVVQTMRSWSTLQPGETFSCFGCHESKNDATPIPPVSEASRVGPKPLRKFYAIPQDSGFSFAKHMQPILNLRCVSCHDAAHPKLNLLSTPLVWDGAAQKYWLASYLQLVKNPVLTGNALFGTYCTWLSPQSIPSMLQPKVSGSIRSMLFSKISTHAQAIPVTQSELDILKCWIDLLVPHDGSYDESMTAANKALYAAKMQKRKTWEAVEAANIQAYIQQSTAIAPAPQQGPDKAMLPMSTVSMVKGNNGIRLSLKKVVPRFDCFEVYNSTGRLVRTIPLAACISGENGLTVPIDGTIGTGLYFVKGRGRSNSLIGRFSMVR